MDIRPLSDRVVIEPLEKEETTAGGILLPDAAREKQTRGRVVAVGPGRLLDDGSRGDVTLSVGDGVIFGKYAGTEVTIGDIDYTIMRAGDVLAKVDAATPAGKGKKSKKSKKK